MIISKRLIYSAQCTLHFSHANYVASFTGESRSEVQHTGDPLLKSFPGLVLAIHPLVYVRVPHISLLKRGRQQSGSFLTS